MKLDKLDPVNCYQALLTHDPRFDGSFFVGVSSTGIYCRPICPAKTPRRENCTFYPSAAAAERAGFRPCLRCRPELAPGNARVDAANRLAATAASRIEDGALSEQSVAALAEELGVSDRHLRRVVQAEFGVSPVELAQTHRLLLAKRLLTDTALPVTEVAYASGFSSLRRFNALFQERYRLNPTALRRGQTTRIPSQTLECELAYQPPLAWETLLRFLSQRAIRGVEAVEGSRYLRTATFGKVSGWLAVEPAHRNHALRVTLSASLAPAIRPAIASVKRLFDLLASPDAINAQLGPLVREPGLRVPGAWDGFEMAVRTILGQQVSVAAATTLAGRFAAAFGEPIETPFPSLTHLSPTAEQVAAVPVDEIIMLGITRARAQAILLLAQAVAGGTLVLEPGVDVAETMARLQAMRGIGEWTAQYIAMRALAWPDAFPHTDLGLRKALGEPNSRRILERAEGWRPWRAYATIHLWHSLEENS